MDQGEPHQLAIGILLDIEEDLQQVDGRDRHDGGGHLDLERGGIDLAEPGYFCSIGIVEAADEILVARDDDHDHEAGHQRGVNQRQHLEDGVRLLQHEELLDELPQLLGEGNRIEQQRHCEAKVEDHQQPARGQDDVLDEVFKLLHGRGPAVGRVP